MKKINFRNRIQRISSNSFLLVAVTFSLFFPLSITFATSGACSGHGGVSCSAGPDSDGSVICMDGWENSSVSYASMKMCGSGSIPVAKPAPVKTIELVVPIKMEEVKVIPVPKAKAKPVPSPAPVPTTPIKKVIVTDTVTVSSTPIIENLVPIEKVEAVPVKEIKQGFWTRLWNLVF